MIDAGQRNVLLKSNGGVGRAIFFRAKMVLAVAIVSLLPVGEATLTFAMKGIGSVEAASTVSNPLTGFQDAGILEKQQDPNAPLADAMDRQRRVISEFLLSWVHAWQESAGNQGTFEPFAYHYADTFFSDSADRKNWLQSKERINSGKEWIQVQLEDVEIVSSPDSEYAVVRFLQKYTSSNYNDSSNKVLILQRGKEGWRIVTERTK
jgi:hypothetical protein